MHTLPSPTFRMTATVAIFAVGALAGLTTIATATVAGAPAPQAHAAAASRATVTIRNIDFHRRSVTIRRGGSVTWRFVDPQVSHNVTSRGTPRFRSSPTKLTGTYTVSFKRAGVYRYVCTIHANMHGRVVVR